MNYSKLNELAAKAMGYVQYENRADMWEIPETDMVIFKDEWNPSTSTDDALVLLEKVAAEHYWRIFWISSSLRGCEIYLTDDPIICNAKTIPLAITFASLRASGIPESEITAALKE